MGEGEREKRKHNREDGIAGMMCNIGLERWEGICFPQLPCGMGAGGIPGREIAYERERMASGVRWAGHRVAAEKMCCDHLQAAENLRTLLALDKHDGTCLVERQKCRVCLEGQ